ncbi:glutathione S-transferase U8 [Citrus sinensis]|nr:glutathione S-transferase U8 [Citrus sinensis]
MATKVKVLGFWCSPFVFRVVWALKLKGVEFEYIEEDVFNKSTRLLELNPVHKKSLVILEYIDETWPQDPLLPQDPYERAMARFWAKFADEKLMQTAWKSTWTKGEEKEDALKATMEALEKIEGELKGKSYFGGENKYAYLEIAIGWINYLIPIWEEIASIQFLDPKRFPAITAWKSKFLDNPLIKETLPPREKLLIYLHQRVKHREIDATIRELAETKLEN